MSQSEGGLAQKHCIPCKGGIPPLRGEELEKLSAQLPDWKVNDAHHLTKTFTFPDFKTALAFVNRAGAVAEAEGHRTCCSLGEWPRALFGSAATNGSNSEIASAYFPSSQ
jgi:4a-hydroxytetrahydrobiopterin dehydratase